MNSNPRPDLFDFRRREGGPGECPPQTVHIPHIDTSRMLAPTEFPRHQHQALARAVNEQADAVERLNRTVKDQSATIKSKTSTIDKQRTELHRMNDSVLDQAAVIKKQAATTDNQRSELHRLSDQLKLLKSLMAEKRSAHLAELAEAQRAARSARAEIEELNDMIRLGTSMFNQQQARIEAQADEIAAAAKREVSLKAAIAGLEKRLRENLDLANEQAAFIKQIINKNALLISGR